MVSSTFLPHLSLPKGEHVSTYRSDNMLDIFTKPAGLISSGSQQLRNFGPLLAQGHHLWLKSKQYSHTILFSRSAIIVILSLCTISTSSSFQCSARAQQRVKFYTKTLKTHLLCNIGSKIHCSNTSAWEHLETWDRISTSTTSIQPIKKI